MSSSWFPSYWRACSRRKSTVWWASYLYLSPLPMYWFKNGFSTALIQKRKVDDTDFSSVFFFNMAVSAVIYLVLFLAAPGITYFTATRR